MVFIVTENSLNGSIRSVCRFSDRQDTDPLIILVHIRVVYWISGFSRF